MTLKKIKNAADTQWRDNTTILAYKLQLRLLLINAINKCFKRYFSVISQFYIGWSSYLAKLLRNNKLWQIIATQIAQTHKCKGKYFGVGFSMNFLLHFKIGIFL